MRSGLPGWRGLSRRRGGGRCAPTGQLGSRWPSSPRSSGADWSTCRFWAGARRRPRGVRRSRREPIACRPGSQGGPSRDAASDETAVVSRAASESDRAELGVNSSEDQTPGPVACPGAGRHLRRPCRVPRGARSGLAVDYAKVRAQYGATIGSYQAVAHLLAESLALIEGLDQRAAPRRLGGGRASRSARRVEAARMAKIYCARAALTVCETSIQVHGGIGNTWECLAHVYLRRALAATELSGPRSWRSCPLDFRDSPEEAAFRDRLRGWLTEQKGKFPTSGDEYWARQGEWHQALYEAGFFGTVVAQGVRRAGSAAGLRRHRRRGDREGRCPGAARPRLPRRRAGPARQNEELRQRFLPGHDQRHRTLVPGLLRARRRVRSGVADYHRHPRRATSTSSTGTRSGRATPTSPTGACCWPAPTRTCPSNGASRRSSSRCTSPASSSDR